MRHHRAKRKFGREAGERRALLRSLARALILKGAITTTTARAKEVRPFVERLVTLGKRGTLASRRVILSRLGGDRGAARKIAGEIAGRFTTRSGGYTRITKLGRRGDDAREEARIEFVA